MHTHTRMQSITCLVQLASVRRSLFNNVERTNFLAQLVKGVRSILEQPQVRPHFSVLYSATCSDVHVASSHQEVKKVVFYNEAAHNAI